MTVAAKEEAKILKGLAIPMIIGTIVVVGIALLGRIITERK